MGAGTSSGKSGGALSWQAQTRILKRGSADADIRQVALVEASSHGWASDDLSYIETVITTGDATEYNNLDTLNRDRVMDVLQYATRSVNARRMYQNGEIEQDTYGQLALGNFTESIIAKAVDRGWITRAQAKKINKL